MALSINLGNLIVFLRGDATQLAKTIKTTEALMVKASATITAAGIKMSLAVTAPLALIGFAAVREFSKFEDAVIEIQKVTDKFTADKLAISMRELSLVMPVSAAALATLAADAARFGVTGVKNIESFTATVARMSIATNLSTEEAGTAFAKLAAITGLPIKDAERLGSTINTLSNTYATSAKEIVSAMLRSAASMKQFGLTVPEMAAFSAVMNEAGFSAERSGTQIRSLMTALSTPQTVIRLSKAMGLTVDQFRNMTKTAPIKTIQDLGKVMASGTFEAFKLGGAMDRETFIALQKIGTAAGRTNAAIKLANQAFKDGTSLQIEAAAAAGTFSSQMIVMWNNVRAVGAIIGKTLVPMILSINKAVVRAASFWRRLSAPVQSMIVKFGLLAAAIGPALLILGKVVALATPLVVFALRMSMAIVQTILWSVALVTRLIPSVVSVTGRILSMTVAIFTRLIPAISGAIVQVIQLSSVLLIRMTPAFVAATARMIIMSKAMLLNLIPAIKKAAIGVSLLSVKIFTVFIPALAVAIKKIVLYSVALVVSLIPAIKRAIIGTTLLGVSLLAGLIPAIKRAILGVIAYSVSLLAGLIPAITAAIAGILSFKLSMLVGLLPAIIGAITGTLALSASFLSTLVPIALVVGAIAGIAFVLLTLTDIGKTVSSGIVSAFSAIGNTITGFVERFKIAFGGIVTAIKEGNIRGALKIVMAQINLEFALGVSVLAKTFGPFIDSFTDAWLTVKSVVLSVIDTITQTFATMVIGIVEGLAFVAQAAIAPAVAARVSGAAAASSAIEASKLQITGELRAGQEISRRATRRAQEAIGVERATGRDTTSEAANKRLLEAQMAVTAALSAVEVTQKEANKAVTKAGGQEGINAQRRATAPGITTPKTAGAFGAAGAFFADRLQAIGGVEVSKQEETIVQEDQLSELKLIKSSVSKSVQQQGRGAGTIRVI